MDATPIITPKVGSLPASQVAGDLPSRQPAQLPLAQDLPQAEFETLLRSGNLDVNYFLRPFCGANGERRHSLDLQKVQFILNEPGLRIETPLVGYPQGVFAGSQESKAVSLVMSKAELSLESLHLLAKFPAAAELMPLYRPAEVLQNAELLAQISCIRGSELAEVRAQAAGAQRGMQEV